MYLFFEGILTTYLFSHETNNTFTTINNNTSVQVIATPINQLLTTTDAAPITITASRMINCIGFDIPFKRSLQLSTSKRIHSLTPAEVLTLRQVLKNEYV